MCKGRQEAEGGEEEGSFRERLQGEQSHVDVSRHAGLSGIEYRTLIDRDVWEKVIESQGVIEGDTEEGRLKRLLQKVLEFQMKEPHSSAVTCEIGAVAVRVSPVPTIRIGLASKSGSSNYSPGMNMVTPGVAAHVNRVVDYLYEDEWVNYHVEYHPEQYSVFADRFEGLAKRA